jgi:hypothetical protein
MGEVVTYRPGGAARASGADLHHPQLATVIILPVVRIERDAADAWNACPCDSQPPPYTAPDTNSA